MSTLHPATTEVETGTATTMHVPHTLLTTNPIQVQRRPPVPEQTEPETEPRTRTETTAWPPLRATPERSPAGRGQGLGQQVVLAGAPAPVAGERDGPTVDAALADQVAA